MENKKKNFYKKGFSLVEVMITLFVLSVGLVGVSSLMTKSIKSSVDAKNQIIASELAQEGIELVKNLKDNNPAFTTEIKTKDEYKVDYLDSYATFNASFSSNAAAKKLYLVGGYYVHGNGATSNETIFRRKISVSESAPDANGKITATVTSFVSWDPNSDIPAPSACKVGNKCISVQSVMPDLE